LSNRTRQVFDTEAGSAWKPIRDEVRPLLLEDLPHRLIRSFRMGMHLGVSDALVGQAGVQLIVGFDPKTRREEPFPDQTNLVLDLTLLPS
jgi:hypothetical protein